MHYERASVLLVWRSKKFGLENNKCCQKEPTPWWIWTTGEGTFSQALWRCLVHSFLLLQPVGISKRGRNERTALAFIEIDYLDYKRINLTPEIEEEWHYTNTWKIIFCKLFFKFRNSIFMCCQDMNFVAIDFIDCLSLLTWIWDWRESAKLANIIARRILLSRSLSCKSR